jgi:diaminopropionate ammonia-lyase
VSSGPASCMGRLDCKEASLIALQGLSRDVDAFVTISESAAQAVLPVLADAAFATSASGGAGLAALLAGMGGIDATSRVLCILSEEPAE